MQLRHVIPWPWFSVMLAGCLGDVASDDLAFTSDTSALRAAVGPNIRVSNDATMAAQDQPAAATALALPGHLLVAAHSYPPSATAPIDGVAAYWRSTDGGRTFPRSGVVPGLVRGYGGDFQGASDLSLACSATGECFLATFLYDTALSRTAIAVVRSPDGGITWQTPRLLIDERDPKLFNERCSIAIDDSFGPNRGAVYVSWIRVATANGFDVPIYFAASHDHGATFSAPRAISDPVENLLTDKPATVVDHSGRVFVVYENFLLNDPLRDRHLVQVSSDGGAQFAAARPIDFVFDTFAPLPPAHFRTNSFPQVAIDPVGDALLVAWTDTRNGGPDVVVTRSTDAGATWSPTRRVTDTPIGAQIQHALPALACGPLGVCGISFYSSRNDAAGLLLDTYFAPIVVGHPGANLRASETPMNPNVQFGGRFIGDYTALVIDALAAHPVWTDTRVALPDPQQDIFTARITAHP